MWRRVGTACLLVAVLAALVVWSGPPAEGAQDTLVPGEAQPLVSRNLTASSGPSYSVRADAGFAVWYLWDGEDQEIMLYEAATGISRRLTNNAYQDGCDEWRPFIAEGYVVWEGSPDEDQEIFLHDIARDTTTRLTSNDNEDAVPWVSREGAVWQVFDGDDYEIVFYDFSSGRAQTLTDNAWDDVYPVIQGGYVTWQGLDGNDWEIFAYSLADRVIQKVTNNEFDDEEPRMHVGRVVWRGMDGSDGDVFLYDLVTMEAVQITDDDVWDDFPLCDGLHVAWAREAASASADANQLMMYTIATRATTVLRGTPVWHTAPSPHGDRVCWAEESVSGGTMEAYSFDLSRNLVVRLTTNQVDDDRPEWDGANWYWDQWYERDGEWEQDVFTAADPSLIGTTTTTASTTSTATTGTSSTTTLSTTTTTSPEPGQTFVDVPQSNPYYQAVQGMAAAGIVGGYTLPGGRREFRPVNPVLRAQFAKMVCGAMVVPVDENTWQDASAPFSDLGGDVAGDLYPHDFVAAAAAAGITLGVRPGEFVPYADIKRAQAITMVVRAAQNLRPGLLAEPAASFTCAVPAFAGVHWPNLRLAEFNGLTRGLQGYGPAWDAWAPMPRGEVAQVLWNLIGLLPF